MKIKNTPNWDKHLDTLISQGILLLIGWLTRLGDRKRHYIVFSKITKKVTGETRIEETEFYGLRKKEITLQLIAEREKIDRDLYDIEIRTIDIVKNT